jgi:heme A synthase
LAWISAGWTYFLVVVGGTVRVNNAGLSCPDWPLCYGNIFSMESLGALLEEFHRYNASIVSTLVIALAVSIFLWARQNKRLLIASITSVALLIPQIILGGLTVLWKLDGVILTLHLATGEAFLAAVLFTAVLTGKKAADASAAEERDRRFAQLAFINATLVYLLLLTGSYVFNSGASLACPGWPLCGNAPEWAVRYHLSDINLLHRGMAILVGLVMIWTLFSAWRRRKIARDQASVALAAGMIFLVQSGVGGLVVLWKKPIYIADLHLALATAVWACMVILAAMAIRRMLVAPDLKFQSDALVPELSSGRDPILSRPLAAD